MRRLQHYQHPSRVFIDTFRHPNATLKRRHLHPVRTFIGDNNNSNQQLSLRQRQNDKPLSSLSSSSWLRCCCYNDGRDEVSLQHQRNITPQKRMITTTTTRYHSTPKNVASLDQPHNVVDNDDTKKKKNNNNNNHVATSFLTTITNSFPTSDATKQENAANYRIMRSLGQHLWPTTTTTLNQTEPLSKENGVVLKQRVLLSIGLMIGAKGITIQVPFLFKHLVDSISSNHPSAAAVDLITTTASATATLSHPMETFSLALILGYGLSRTTATLFQELRNTIFHTVVLDATRTIASQVLFHTLHNLDLQYHLSKSTGQLSRTMEHGLRSIVTILNSMVFQIVPTVVEVSLVTGVMYYQFGMSHASVVLGTVVAYTAFTIAITSWRTKFRRDMNRLGAEANGRTVDSFLNYETIQYFNNVQHELHRYNSTMKSYNSSSQLAQKSLSFLNVGQSAIFSAGLTAVMYLTYDQILNDQASIGDLVLANGLLFQVSVPLFFIGSVYRELKQSFIDMEKMNDLTDTKPSIVDAVNAITYDASTMGTSITLQDVHFAYPNRDTKLSDSTTNGRPILQGTTFTVPQGTTTAIVGSSGCGKSTILRLLYRFYEADTGTVLIGGNDVRVLQKESLQKSIAVIPQDVVLFNETIGYNVNYGNLNASMDQVIAAAKKAKIHDTIMSFPAGYDTVVGERGLKLSGGEKQRVSIARAILKDSPILLCDEPTSSLDSETEMDIMSNIKSIGSDRSTIIIAHRLSTIQDCDQIIVMHQGRVVECGTHEELIRMNGRYTELLKMQQENTDP